MLSVSTTSKPIYTPNRATLGNKYFWWQWQQGGDFIPITVEYQWQPCFASSSLDDRIFLVFTIPILTIYRHPNIEQAIFLITLIDPFIHYPGIDRTSLTWYPLPTTNDYVIK